MLKNWLNGGAVGPAAAAAAAGGGGGGGGGGGVKCSYFGTIHHQKFSGGFAPEPPPGGYRPLDPRCWGGFAPRAPTGSTPPLGIPARTEPGATWESKSPSEASPGGRGGGKYIRTYFNSIRRALAP